uniref:Spermatogenesis associated 7 n=1 Tax=Myripristis murdjan TaxID=586833 RepID=A0A668AWS4_9TELE
MQGEESPYFCSGSSIISTPRFNTSFHVKQIVYPSCRINDFRSHSHPTRPASEFNYRSPEAPSRRQQSACSAATSGSQACYKTFQDPMQKTYSGDLLQRHSQHFTQDKPFTPKTLKSDKSSYLSNYSYYRAPRRNPNQDCINPRLIRQETYQGTTQTKERSSVELDDLPQVISTEHEWSEDELSGPNLSVSRHVSAVEEELMYLEFISDVTEDILARGHFSDRVLDLVIKRHIDMNKHRLDEGKMRHFLEGLRKEFEAPVSTPTTSSELEGKEDDMRQKHFPRLQSRASKQVEIREDNDNFPYASLIKYCDSPENAISHLVSTSLHRSSPQRTASPSVTNKLELEGRKKGSSSPWFSENGSEYAGINEEDCHQNQTDTTGMERESVRQNHVYNSEEDHHEDHAEVNDGLSREVDDLERSF